MFVPVTHGPTAGFFHYREALRRCLIGKWDHASFPFLRAVTDKDSFRKGDILVLLSIKWVLLLDGSSCNSL